MTSQRRKPVSLAIEGEEKAVVIREELFEQQAEAIAGTVEVPQRKTSSAFKWLIFSVLGLVLFILGFDLWLFTSELLQIHPALGYVVLAMAISATLSLLYLIGKEIAAIRRFNKMSDIRQAAVQAIALGDNKQATAIFKKLQTHYEKVPEQQLKVQELSRHEKEGYNGQELLAIAERSLLETIDKKAVSLINAQARNTALLTTISPYAILDVLVTVWRNLKLIRQIAELYGASPGSFGSIKLMRQVLAHIAITGGMEAGDSLVNEVFGGSFLTKLSTKLGEAVINGLLTARVGLTAINQIRPLPYTALPKPTVKDVAKDIVREFKDRLV